MGIGVSLILIAVGVVLVVVGAVCLLLSLTIWSTWGGHGVAGPRRRVTTYDPIERPPG
jgi:hypothetical protein